MGKIRVENAGEVYEFDPDEQRRVTPLDLFIQRVPMPLRMKVKLATLSVVLKGIKEVKDDNSRKTLGGS